MKLCFRLNINFACFCWNLVFDWTLTPFLLELLVWLNTSFAWASLLLEYLLSLNTYFACTFFAGTLCLIENHFSRTLFKLELRVWLNINSVLAETPCLTEHQLVLTFIFLGLHVWLITNFAGILYSICASHGKINVKFHKRDNLDLQKRKCHFINDQNKTVIFHFDM